MTGADTASQRVLVTAGAGGAGRVIARLFHAAGARVAVCDLDRPGLRTLADACPGLVALDCDAGDADAIEQTAKAVLEAFGGLDVLVNNVGRAGPTAGLEDILLAEWNAMLTVNLTSHFLFMQAFVPTMKTQGSGLVVNISSGSVKTGLPLRTPYVVSKGALLSLTLNGARELGPHGIRVNCILPGPIRGERISRVIREKAVALGMDEAGYEASLVRYTSMRTLVEPEDIAAMVAFLASTGGERISGQMIGVDGHLEWEE